MINMVFYMCFVIFLSSCANIIMPTGGDIDKSAPKVISISPEKNSINFQSKEVVITFDEYVKIDNLSSINFFPTIDPAPIIKTKGKSIVVELVEQLKNNTTYTINFNNSIVDLNEGNAYKNLKYIFSTGEKIDSCKITGKIIDLKTNIPQSGARIGLFKNIILPDFDSIIRKVKPDYFVFSDDDGEFSLSNLENGKYYLYGHQDLNKNTTYESKEPVSIPIQIDLSSEIEKNIYLFIENDIQKNITPDCYKKNKISDSIPIGRLNIIFDENLVKNKNYIGELLKNDTTFLCLNVLNNSTKIDSLPIGVYKFRMFEDANENNYWDSGSIKFLKPPEEILFYQDTIFIKENWEVDVLIK